MVSLALISTKSLLSVYSEESDNGGKIVPFEYLLKLDDLLPSSLESVTSKLEEKGIDVESFTNLNTLSVEIPSQIIQNYSLLERRYNNFATVEHGFVIKKNTTISDIEKIFNIHSSPYLIRTIPLPIENNLTLNSFLTDVLNITSHDNGISNTTKVCETILKVNPLVTACQPNFTIVPTGTQVPNHIQRIGDRNYVNNLVNNTIGIAIVDTGVINHTALNLIKSISCLDADYINKRCTEQIPSDDNGHGTHVAGISAAKGNSINAVGTAPGFNLYSIKVMPHGTAKNILRAIDTIGEINKNNSNIKVVNFSFGCSTSTETCSPDKTVVVDEAIRQSINSGITYVIAAGNQNKPVAEFWPAYIKEAIVVTAIEDHDGKCGGLDGPEDDVLWHDSDYDPSGIYVDIAAPGVNITSTSKSGYYETQTGTSQAAPLVAGVIASYSAIHPNLSQHEVERSVIDMGIKGQTNCDGEAYGYFTGDKDNFTEPLLYTGNIH